MPIVFLRDLAINTRNKFRALGQQTEDGYFDSKGELRRWRQLQLLQRAGQITGLARQVPFQLAVQAPSGKMVTIGTYVADFVYRERPDPVYIPPWPVVVEDFKGWRTPLYRWKKKHVEVQYGVTIRETE